MRAGERFFQPNFTLTTMALALALPNKKKVCSITRSRYLKMGIEKIDCCS